jgi:aspartate/methionine/tyrosine aminotransferase
MLCFKHLYRLNTPHNPTGKVFTIEELTSISEILNRHTHVTAVMDEVYEKLVYDGKSHVRLASLPGTFKNKKLKIKHIYPFLYPKN